MYAADIKADNIFILPCRKLFLPAFWKYLSFCPVQMFEILKIETINPVRMGIFNSLPTSVVCW